MHKLEDFAKIALGQKTLLNDFFHLDLDTVRTFGIEDAYAKPVYLMTDLDSTAYFQTKPTRSYVFDCREIPADLRGTGAGRYIDWGANQTTRDKKQAGTVRMKWPHTDNMKGKKHWYWPSDPPKEGKIALRKGIGDVYAPFLFEQDVAFDQRLYVVHATGIREELLAAYLSSSAFALSLEVSADMGLGGGVLSLGTRALRALPVPDLAQLDRQPHRKAILEAARALHSMPPPVASEYAKHAAIRTLDEAILSALGFDSNRSMELENEVGSLACARRGIQQMRKKAVAQSSDVNVGAVAAGVTKRLERWLAPRAWPEESISNKPSTILQFPAVPLDVDVSIIMGQGSLTIRNPNGKVILKQDYPEPLVEVIIRGLQLGRRTFPLPDDEDTAEAALSELRDFIVELEREFDEAMAATGVGLRFEDDVKRRALSAMNIDLAGLRGQFKSGLWSIGPSA